TEDLESDLAKLGTKVKFNCYLTNCYLMDLKFLEIINSKQPYPNFTHLTLGQKIILTKINAI
ncbi:MAG: hypothetical protein KA327_12435, partial [Pseudarcicella sp.]|nr:hypothetical protein [Pseudarcicella sp.]